MRKVLFGSGLTYWLHELLLLDALTYLTNGRFSLPLKRYVQIDIDDIFVGERGTRLRAPDVLELVNFQKRLQAMIPDFQFNLGFSGKYYHRGYPEENEGDDMIISELCYFFCLFTLLYYYIVCFIILLYLENAHLFRWFCHMYSHSQAHITNNLTHIETEMLMNQEFAKVSTPRCMFDSIVHLEIGLVVCRLTHCQCKASTSSHHTIRVCIQCTSHCTRRGSECGRFVCPAPRSILTSDRLHFDEASFTTAS